MRQEEFERLYQTHWEEVDDLLTKHDSAKRRKTIPETALLFFPDIYRKLCHSLAIAKNRQYSPRLVDHLNELAVKGHQLLYTRQWPLHRHILYFIYHGFAKAIQQHKGLFWLTHFIFYGPGLVFFALIQLNPELIYSVVDPEQVNYIESMYDPEARVLGRERESDSDVMMFGHYIYNNISIAFRTFAGGILFTLGSLFFLIFNGVFFGALSSHMVHVQFTSTFFPFVIGHGSFELTAILIAGMAGIHIGWSLIAPKNFTRIDALKMAGKRAVTLLYGATFFLLIAAFIEAFWSSSTSLSITTKYTVGGLLWLFVYCYLLFPRKQDYEA